MPVRPVMRQFLSTPWVAATPVDDSTVARIVPQQVQIAFQGTGRLSERELVALTPAAHELLYGRDRDGARRVLRGMLATLDGREGALNLRGVSLSSDVAAFATNMMLSNVESGFLVDSVTSNDRARFEHDFQQIAYATKGAKAQNTGWMDLGPDISGKVRTLMTHGAGAGRALAEEVGLTFAHELQHSHTRPDPDGIPGSLVWLEEGTAEALAWWPGTTSAIVDRMGGTSRPGWNPDPWTAPKGTTASFDYRQHQNSVLRLLALAGIEMFDQPGRPNEQGRIAAERVLQTDELERVPRNLARAIGRKHDLDAPNVVALEQLIRESNGSRDNIDAIVDLVR